MTLGSQSHKVITVFVIATVRLYREGLALVLQRSPRLEVVGTSDDAHRAAPVIAAAQPHVVLLDASRGPRGDAIAVVHRSHPAARVVAFGVPDVESQIVVWAELGAVGCVSPMSSLDDLVAAVEDASRGELRCSPRVAGALLRRVAAAGRRAVTTGPEWELLTSRETEVLWLVESGLSNKEIAATLHIAVPTVKNHVHNVLQKLNATSRTDAIARLHVGVRPVQLTADR